MTDISLLRKALKNLCTNEYSKENILIVVRYFSSQCQNLLRNSEAINFITYNETGNINQKLVDYSLDLIASLFARNEIGEFIILKKRFVDILDKSNESIEKYIRSIIKLCIKNGMVRYYEESDPVGKIFYRSLRYILEKNCNWEKSVLNGFDQYINKVGSSGRIATIDEVNSAFSRAKQKTITNIIKAVISDLVEFQNLSVSVAILITTFRNQLSHFFNATSDSIEVSFGDSSVLDAINISVNEVDELILSKYVQSGKLSMDEKIAFKSAITALLGEYITHGKNDNHYYYLSKYIYNPITLTDYNKKYKNRFEYVVRKSKDIFSVVIINGSNK